MNQIQQTCTVLILMEPPMVPPKDPYHEQSLAIVSFNSVSSIKIQDTTLKTTSLQLVFIQSKLLGIKALTTNRHLIAINQPIEAANSKVKCSIYHSVACSLQFQVSSYQWFQLYSWERQAGKIERGKLRLHLIDWGHKWRLSDRDSFLQ